MIDIHCHIMYGIDDGSKDIEMSKEILKDAYNNGITDIILTPHYIENSKYQTNNKDKNKIIKSLEKELKKENININLYTGNEIFIFDNILEYIKNDEIAPLNNTKYLLIELPMGRPYNNTKDIFFNLIRKGYKVVLAHPERYRYMQDNDKLVDELIELGVLLQGNYRSLFGYYGKDAKKALKHLIKHNKVTFLGSDIHRPDGYNTEKLLKKLIKLTKSEEKAMDLLENNARNMLLN